MTQIRSYRDLIAWQKAMDLVVYLYRETAKLPDDERFGLRGQMRRSAVRIPSTIAEGWGRRSTGDYVRFLKIAQGSVYELLTQAELARRLWARRALEGHLLVYGRGRSNRVWTGAISQGCGRRSFPR